MQATEATRTPAEASAAATTAIIVAFFADAVAAGYSEDAMRTTFECGMDGVAAVVSTKIVAARAQNSSGTDAQIDSWIVNKYKDKVAAAMAAYLEKNMIGEKMYPKVQNSNVLSVYAVSLIGIHMTLRNPDLAGKITGMLLDGMETSELLHLLESQDALNSKIEEAISVLEASATGN